MFKKPINFFFEKFGKPILEHNDLHNRDTCALHVPNFSMHSQLFQNSGEETSALVSTCVSVYIVDSSPVYFHVQKKYLWRTHMVHWEQICTFLRLRHQNNTEGDAEYSIPLISHNENVIVSTSNPFITTLGNLTTTWC